MGRNLGRVIKKIISSLMRSLWTSINRAQLKLRGAKVGKGFSAKGLIFIRNYGSLVIGDNVRINSGLRYNPIGGANQTSIVVRKGGSLTIGSDCYISNATFFCAEKISVGKGVFIGGDSRFYDTDFHSLTYKDRHILGRNIKSRPIVIDEGVFIGSSAFILKGTRIGPQSVIGCGAIVAGKQIGGGAIWAGNPARFIKKNQID
jgi:acetyltransferase-like isoleucine patch superfamily enzyme